MLYASVIGAATATLRHPSLDGCKLLVVQPLSADGRTPDGEPQVAVDRCGAGIGDAVVITSDGTYVREILGCDNTPVRWGVMALIDPPPS